LDAGLIAGLDAGLVAGTSSSSFGTASSSSSSSSDGRIGADGGLTDRVTVDGLTDGSNDFGGGGGRLREGLTDCFTFGGLDGVGSTVTTVLCGLRDWANADSMVGADLGAEALIDTSGGGGKLRDALMDGSRIGGKLNDTALLVTGSLTDFTDLLGAAEDNGVTEGVTDCFKLARGSDPIGL
jgi:hypothetical protein